MLQSEIDEKSISMKLLKERNHMKRVALFENYTCNKPLMEINSLHNKKIQHFSSGKMLDLLF